MWKEYNPNPMKRRVEDCAVRAVAKALDIGWEEAYALLSAAGYAMGDMPHSNAVWGAVLRQHGYYRDAVPNKCPDCYTAADFARDHPKGTFILGFGNHAATVVDGDIYDSFDSSSEIPQYFWFVKDKK